MTDETTAPSPAPGDAWGDTAAFQEAAPAVESDSVRAYDPVGQSDPLTDEHPEAIVGAALAGGFLFAKILKRLGR